MGQVATELDSWLIKCRVVGEEDLSGERLGITSGGD